MVTQGADGLLFFPVWVGMGLVFQIVVGSALAALSSTASQDSSLDVGGIAPWVYAMVYAAFVVQGVALAIAFACHVRCRWGRVLGRRTGEVIAVPSARSWPQSHLVAIAELVAVMAVLVALLCAYWAVGAVVAAVGLLGLAGRWGRERQFWLPAALTWVGSGALVAFDVLMVVINRLFFLFGPPRHEADWAPIDTVLVIKIVVGVLASVVGVLAVTPAARETPGPLGA